MNGWPTNPSYIRRIVKARGFDQVRVSPSTGEVCVRNHGEGWQRYGSTQSVLDAAKAEHSAKYARSDAEHRP